MKELENEDFRNEYFQGRKKEQVESDFAVAYLSFCLFICSLVCLIVWSILK